MPNLLFDMLGGSMPSVGNLGNIGNMISQFQQFRNSFQGDARQQVQELLNSGRMSQAQFNQLQAMATQLQNILK